MPADALPVLPRDERVTVGRLENGISYYIVSNSLDGDVVDIALVQKAGRGSETLPEKGISEVHSRGALSDLPRFNSPSPLEYLVSKSVWPGRNGYATVSEDATIFNFKDVPVSTSGEAVDSTLLMIFEIAASAPGASIGRYAPDNQAIIVAGNVNPKTVTGKLEMLSMLVQKRPATSPQPYRWQPSDKPEYRIIQKAEDDGLSTFKLVWRSPRTPSDQMETVLPVVSKMFYDELGALISKRLKVALREGGIPVADFGSKYIDSGITPADETFSVYISTGEEYIASAAEALCTTLSRLHREGITATEYRDIRLRVRTDYVAQASRSDGSNADLLKKCSDAFLYGRPLSTNADRLAFISSRKMDDETAVGLFNNFTQALLDGSKNLTVHSKADTLNMSRSKVVGIVSDAWTKASDSYRPIPFGFGDTLGIAYLNNTRVRLRESVSEPMTGGRILSFSNGIKVILKQNSFEEDYIRMTLLFRGGYSQIPGLNEGEGAYVADMLLTGNIGSMPGYRFSEMLRSNSISYEVEVSPSEFRLSAHLPVSKLPLLMKSLSAVANDITVDREQYEYYRSCKRLTGVNILSDELPEKSKAFFEKAFGGIKDAVWLVTGDIDEATLRRVLLSNLGRFKSEGSSLTRFRGRPKAIVGERIDTLPAAKLPKVEMSFTTATISFGLQNFIASGIIDAAVRNAVAEAVAPMGWYCESDWNLRMFPDDRLTVHLRLSPAAFPGLPASMVRTDSLSVVLPAVSRALDALQAEGISDNLLARSKSAMLSGVSSWQNNADAMTRLLELRYMYGMDFMTDVKAKTDALSKETIDKMLTNLLIGGRSKLIVPALPAAETEEVLPEEPSLPDAPAPAEPSDKSGLLAAYRRYILGIAPPRDSNYRLALPLDSILSMLRDSTRLVPVGDSLLPDSLSSTAVDSVAVPAAADSLITLTDGIR